MSTTSTAPRVTLLDREAKVIGQHSKRHGFVIILDFGPRYRRVRANAVYPTLVEATRAAREQQGRYRQRSRAIVHRVNPSGRILDTTEV